MSNTAKPIFRDIGKLLKIYAKTLAMNNYLVISAEQTYTASSPPSLMISWLWASSILCLYFHLFLWITIESFLAVPLSTMASLDFSFLYNQLSALLSLPTINLPISPLANPQRKNLNQFSQSYCQIVCFYWAEFSFRLPLNLLATLWVVLIGFRQPILVLSTVVRQENSLEQS